MVHAFHIDTLRLKSLLIKLLGRFRMCAVADYQFSFQEMYHGSLSKAIGHYVHEYCSMQPSLLWWLRSAIGIRSGVRCLVGCQCRCSTLSENPETVFDTRFVGSWKKAGQFSQRDSSCPDLHSLPTMAPQHARTAQPPISLDIRRGT